MIMYTFSGSIILSILLLSLNGLSGHPIGERNAYIENFDHKPNECTPALQAERDNTHDIACIVDTFEPFADSLNQQVNMHYNTY